MTRAVSCEPPTQRCAHVANRTLGISCRPAFALDPCDPRRYGQPTLNGPDDVTRWEVSA